MMHIGPPNLFLVLNFFLRSPSSDAFTVAPTKPWSAHVRPSSVKLGSTVESSADTDTDDTDVSGIPETGKIGENQTEFVHPLMDVASQLDDRSPVEIENEKFECDETVEFWRNFQRDGFNTAQENVQELLSIATDFGRTRDGADYWLRHTETALCYQQDYKRIQTKKYNKPYDMYQSTRQSSPLYAGRQTSRFVREAIGTLSRRIRGAEEDKRIWLSDDASPSLYPDYYRTAFHYQADGWMSQASAQVYETSTETLFLGRQDAMQRTALSPLASYSREIKGGNPMKVLEVAAGTGRFMTFARDSLPLDTDYTAVDLSPYYLDVARDNDANWRRVRERVEQESGNPVKLKHSRLIQAKAEELPFDDREFDAVVCIYLFHELPRLTRAQVAAEMARVVKPGGRVILTDSTQLGDRPVYDRYMTNFEKMNEPYYCDYTEDNLPLHFERSGLECLTKAVCSSTKTLTFTKGELE